MARGWKTFKLTGNKEFAMIAAKHARAMNIQCEISIFDGIFDIRGRKIMVMPTPPVDPKAPKPQADAPAPDADASGTKAPEVSGKEAVIPGGSAKPEPGRGNRKRPPAADAIDDEPEIQAYQP